MTGAKTSRALTLTEVLAATVILAALIITCMPWLSAVHQAARPQGGSILPRELSTFADGVIADPAAVGVESLEVIDLMTLDWLSSDTGTRHVSIRRLEIARDEEQQPDHAWLVFEYQNAVALRWIKLSPSPPVPDQEPSP